jgi:hypothetical protein
MEYSEQKLKRILLAIKLIQINEDNDDIQDIDCLDIPENLVILIKNKSLTLTFLINKIKEYRENKINKNELIYFVNDKDKPKRKDVFKKIESYLIDNTSRDYIIQQYKFAKEQYELNNINKKYIYPNQIKAAEEIVNAFLNKNKKGVSLIALPQVGKTGTFIYTAYLMATHHDNNKILKSTNIFIITGMSDVEWEKQTINDMLECFKDNVFHHGKLPKFMKKFEKTEGKKLLIIDESHIGIKQKQRIDNILCNILGINKKINVEDLDDIYILSVSATPGVTLLDMEKFGKYHEKIYIESSINYVGFKKFIEQERIENSKQITDDFLNNNILTKINERFKTPKYHIFRISSLKSAELIKKFCEKHNFEYIYHNSVDYDKDFEDKLKIQPLSHTFYLIKQFFRAGKRLIDTNIGIAYEYSALIDMEKTPQGLVGRFCGNDKIKDKIKSPYFYCNTEAIKKYIEFIENKCEWTYYKSKNLYIIDKVKHTYNPSTLQRISDKNYEDNIITKDEDRKKYIDVPHIFNIDEEDYEEIIDTDTDAEEKEEIIKYIVKKYDRELYKTLCKYIKSQISQPKSKESYKKHITDSINASENDKPFIIDVQEKHKYKNIWMAFIDNNKLNTDEELKIIILVYHGENKIKENIKMEDNDKKDSVSVVKTPSKKKLDKRNLEKYNDPEFIKKDGLLYDKNGKLVTYTGF